ncbi:PQQ-dependent dehydrogenase, methanol/ethanol family [Aquabacterium sp.]|uniref:PQQ-dependent dehydrogenase, methanol/ethanol family n=1 Tax=Aquabacterium sp. TaxID=1872578 RepID=UPI002B561E73|nr:PQQ-dependent dehydrogenase, methanol/ethanol family [Aquabacterium sp.]HSW06550.1 PQQ-dependent dehydrogenase, methanol/ethanol family [Aquabacterium sp.]
MHRLLPCPRQNSRAQAPWRRLIASAGLCLTGLLPLPVTAAEADPGQAHYSPLRQIHAGNVQRLGLAWEFKTGTHRVLEATPVQVGKLLITSGPLGKVWALDATTGKQRWAFDPVVDMQVNRSACCDWANRGVAVKDGLVHVAALDGMLYALDATTGRVRWKVDTIVDRTRGYTSTGAPAIAGDLVIIGNAGAEYDTRGYVTAYDRSSGRQAWRFWTIPRDPKLGPQEAPYLDAALKTWSKDTRWDVGGGGTAWDAIVFDPLTNNVIVGTGNGGPYQLQDRSPGGGDNLYLASIVALDAKTGLPRWHYQETPGDSWDYTATQPMVLTELDIDGQRRPVLLHAPKNGFLYVLDRRDGKLLRAHKLVRTNWAKRIDLATGRPEPDPAGDYTAGPKIVFPAVSGAHNWHPMAWHPGQGLLYVPVQEMGNLIFRLTDGKAPRQARRLNAGAAMIFTPDLPAVLPQLPPPLQEAVKALPEWADPESLKGRAFLRAIDPLSGRVAWQAEGSSAHDRAGVLATAGELVFQGTDAGDFKVYHAKTGALLKSINIGTSIVAAPMSYRLGGQQYVAVAAGGGGGGWGYPRRTSAQYQHGNAGRILVFKLDGGPVAKPAPREFTPIPAPPAQQAGVTPATIGQGAGLFMANCAICHANQTGSNVADLRRMQPATHGLFRQIVRDGIYLPMGMPRWNDVFSENELDALHAYLIALQGQAHAEQQQALKEGRDPNAIGATSLRAH